MVDPILGGGAPVAPPPPGSATVWTSFVTGKQEQEQQFLTVFFISISSSYIHISTFPLAIYYIDKRPYVVFIHLLIYFHFKA